MTPGALSHIESGRRLPNPSNTLRIAEVLGIEPRLLMDALNYEHSERRERTAYESRDASGAKRSVRPRALTRSGRSRSCSQRPAASGRKRSRTTSIAAFAPSPNMLRISPSMAPSPRDRGALVRRHPQRLQALEQLADTASDAIRTLRGLLEDEDPMVRKEARRLLRELDVRLPEE